ncbi:hypothetical protein L6V77_23755 [Myxococcota bacterium]|nr:hypothetical protein [Myxococcota bacterium]
MTRPFRAFACAASAAALFTAAACESTEPLEGLARTRREGGPRVVFDLDARPLPEIPFPNDLATRPDATSPTGRRLNLSLIGPTLLESGVRAKADRLDGFGTFSPITVRFDARLDVADLRARHRDRDPENDAVYLFDIDPDSPGFGEAVALDLGYYADAPADMPLPDGYAVPKTGRFPSGLDKTDQYFEFDPRAGTSTLLFETVEETDTNGNGQLDRDEDTDADGVWDKPNTVDGKPRPPGTIEEVDALLPFYESETNTLIFRPVVPLREGTTYAVVLTTRVRGEGGAGADGAGGPAAESPFDFVNHTRQNAVLAPLPEVLSSHALGLGDVAFTWAFSTQTSTRELHAIRDGLNGRGSLSWLAERFPAEVELFPWWTNESVEACGGASRPACQPAFPDAGVLDTERLLRALRLVAPLVAGDDVQGLLDSYKYVSHIVAGTFASPNFLVDRDGLATEGNPQDDDESFEVDVDAGTAVVGDGRVTFWCTVPKSLEYTAPDGSRQRHAAPFPVVFYGHGYGGARFEMLGFAGHHARFGLATCSIDAAGHGLVIPPDYATAVNALLNTLKSAGMDPALAVQGVTAGRARDLNNDGVPDSGGDFWTADTFHTRDMVRQSAVDQLQLLRILRSFDGQGGPAGGDFDRDGTPDLGGERNDYFSWGQSLGGILSVLAPVVDRHFVAAAPVAGGAGLVDIGIRSSNAGVPEAVVLRMMGPMIVGAPVFAPPAAEGEAPVPTGEYDLEWLVPNTSPPGSVPETQRVHVARVPLSDGDVVVVRNLTREANTALGPPDERWALVRAGQGFRTQFAADAWSATEKRGRLGLDPAAPDYTPLRLTHAQVLESGDRFVFEIYRDDLLVAQVDAWHDDVEFQGTIYPAGTPLVAPAIGLGHRRQSPDLRRFFGIAQAILDAGDPAAYARRYFIEPLDLAYQGVDGRDETRALVVPTTGDQNVPVNSGLSLARAMGIIDTTTPRDDLYGLTEDDFLLVNGVYEGARQFPRWTDARGAFNFDPDDLDNGTDGLNITPAANAKLRLLKPTPGGGQAALRMPYTARNEHDGENANSDTHGFDASTPNRAFDINSFMAQQISFFFMMRGQGIDPADLDAPCLEYLGNCSESCAFAPTFPDETPTACAATP